MLLLCGVLTLLQFYWTDRLADAEKQRLRENLEEAAEYVTRTFDAEVSASRAALLPTGAELSVADWQASYALRYRAWEREGRKPLFSNVALVLPSPEGARLYVVDSTSGTPQLTRDWPDRLLPLRPMLEAMSTGRRPPRPDGQEPRDVLSFPVFGFAGREPDALEELFPELRGDMPPGPRGRPGDTAWLLLEMAPLGIADFLGHELMIPRLGPGLFDVWIGDPELARPYFMTGAKARETAPDVDLPFFYRGYPSGEELRGPGGPLWVFRGWHRPEALKEKVATTRRQNLVIALALNALILVAGAFLLVSARRSRRLAEAQLAFTATVSHELRTPLTVIRGAAHNIRRGVVKDPKRVDEYLGLIEQHAEQLGAMVEQVLEHAALERRKGEGAPRLPVALPALLKEAVDDTAGEVAAAGCRVELDVEAPLPAVSGDAAALVRAVRNLISNAAKHGGAGGWIGVRARAVKGGVEIRVADRGPGIPEGEREEIFRPFIRGAGARAAQTRGSGLGLSLVRDIVSAHGGSVQAREAAPKGAEFIINLPAAA
jgi:signal transduction histidine kinase